MQKTLLRMLAAYGVIGAGMIGAAVAGQAKGYIERYVFVPSAETSATTVVDTDTDRISGTLDIGFVPRQVEVSRELTKLVATDGRAAITVLGVFGGSPKQIALPNSAQRLVLGSRGRIVAAIDLAGGAIALVDLDGDRVMAAIGGLPPLRDVIFGDQDTLIYVAAEGSATIRVIDVLSGQIVRAIDLDELGETGIASFIRTPDDRRLLVQPQGGGPIDVLDLGQGRSIERIDVARGAGPATPSGTGAILLIPDDARQTLMVRSERFGEPVTLRGAAAVTGIYTAWLDSVGFVASAAPRRLLVYDLDRPSLAGEIALSGAPVRGAVTADSRKLYLPVTEPPQLVVVDGKTQRVVANIDLPSKPLVAIVAGGWGVCH